jgi:DNA-binding transcriptional LysR family regulator
LLCRKDDPVAKKKSVPWAILATRPFIGLTHSSSVRPLLDQAFISLGLRVKLQYEVDHLSLVGAMVSTGLGLSVMPRLALALIDCSELASVALQEHVVERLIGSVRRIDMALSPAAQRLHEALIDEVAERNIGRGARHARSPSRVAHKRG